jgi:hypothetical protein
MERAIDPYEDLGDIARARRLGAERARTGLRGIAAVPPSAGR